MTLHIISITLFIPSTKCLTKSELRIYFVIQLVQLVHYDGSHDSKNLRQLLTLHPQSGREKDESWWTTFSILFSIGPHPSGWCSAYLGQVYQHQFIRFRNSIPVSFDGVLQVILDPIQLTIGINYNRTYLATVIGPEVSTSPQLSQDNYKAVLFIPYLKDPPPLPSFFGLDICLQSLVK